MRVCGKCGLNYPSDEERCFVDGELLVEAEDPWLGTVLNGQYMIESVLGEGGMATVYRATHTLVDRPVAVKIMSRQLAKQESLRERFRREAKNARSIAHPNIIEIHEIGETPTGEVFLVMELLEGSPLNEVMSRGPMSPALVASFGLQIAQGLARAHDFDVIHRDLKPENIFVCDLPGDRQLLKLLDFGIARSMHDERLTSAGEIFGTPQYMAPERVTSIDAGPSADLYAFGIILFEMVTGQLPLEADSIPAFFMKHLTEEPPRPSTIAPNCPRRLEELIMSLLKKKPEERPVDAHQVIKELSAIAPSTGRESVVPPRPLSMAPRVAPTLPATTLERWAHRAVVFDQMLVRAYPNAAPENQTRALDRIRESLMGVQRLRKEGLRLQRELEASEHNAREGRERLGNAVQTLAEDLSSARTAARGAKEEVQPYLDAEADAQDAYRSAFGTLSALGGLQEASTPRADLVSGTRDVADALDRWVLTRAAADKARKWIDAKGGEVSDLEFQVKALRTRLEKSEAEHESQRSNIEQGLRQRGEQANSLENDLLETASNFVAPLRTRTDLSDLFAQLETSAEGIRRPQIH